MGLLYDLTKDWCTMDGDVTFMMNWVEDLTTDGSGRVAAIAPLWKIGGSTNCGRFSQGNGPGVDY
jgi:hypothetical protein